MSSATNYLAVLGDPVGAATPYPLGLAKDPGSPPHCSGPAEPQLFLALSR